MLVLGINAYGHDPAVAALVDGELRFFLEEERCLRVKHATGALPVRALAEAFRHLKLGAGDAGAIGYPFDTKRYVRHRVLRHGLFALRPTAFWKTAAVSVKRSGLGRDLASATGCGRLPVPRFLDHHLCHAASAFFCSPFDDAAALTVDGAGEDATIAIHRCEGTRVTTIGRVVYPASLGAVYSSIALHLGFGGGSPEGKLMGLAAYGEPTMLPRFRELVAMPREGELLVDLRAFAYPGMRRGVGPALARELGPARGPGEPLLDRHKDIAASVQARLEEVMVAFARHALARCGSKNLCLAGGVALNSVANRKVLDESGCAGLFVMPASHDAGAAIGAAFLLACERGPLRRPEGGLGRAAFGALWDAADVERFLEEAGVPSTRTHDLPAAVADDVAKGLVVGFHNGRDEAGPRALGSRSLFADPRRPEMRDHLNRKVKGREDFRPLAPMLREEDVPAYFVDPVPSPFMLLTARANDLGREKIPAALHVDGTARLQTVNRHHAPLHHRILGEVGLRTGVPVMINTSFNVRGEPLVHSPADAYRCFLGTAIDALYLGPFRIAAGTHLPALRDGSPGRARGGTYRTLDQ